MLSQLPRLTRAQYKQLVAEEQDEKTDIPAPSEITPERKTCTKCDEYEKRVSTLNNQVSDYQKNLMHMKVHFCQAMAERKQFEEATKKCEKFLDEMAETLKSTGQKLEAEIVKNGQLELKISDKDREIEEYIDSEKRSERFLENIQKEFHQDRKRLRLMIQTYKTKDEQSIKEREDLIGELNTYKLWYVQNKTALKKYEPDRTFGDDLLEPLSRVKPILKTPEEDLSRLRTVITIED